MKPAMHLLDYHNHYGAPQFTSVVDIGGKDEDPQEYIDTAGVPIAVIREIVDGFLIICG